MGKGDTPRPVDKKKFDSHFDKIKWPGIGMAIGEGRLKSEWQKNKDRLDNRRKTLAGQIKEGIMSKSEMNSGEEGQPEFTAKVERYDKWKKKNESRTTEFLEINRTFKKQGEEGKPMSLDTIREAKVSGKNIKYQ